MYDVIFAHEGVDALWGDSTSPVRIIRTGGPDLLTAGVTRIVANAVFFKGRYSQIPSPKKNDLVTVLTLGGAQTFKVLDAAVAADDKGETFLVQATAVA